MRPMLRHVPTLLGLVLLALFATNVGRYLLSPSPDRVRADDTRRADRVEPGADDRDELALGALVGGNGVVEPSRPETRLAASVAARVARIHVAEGQVVTAGTVLVELEHDVEDAALAAAEADVRVAQAELSRVARGNRLEEVEGAEADAAAARARADQTADRLTRLEAVASAGGVSDEELTRTRRDAQSSEEQARSIEARLRAVRAGSRTEEVAAARARLAAAAARRDQAVAARALRLVTAPIDATVLELKYRVGEFVSPGQGEPLAVLGDVRVLRVRMDLDERDVGRVSVGQSAFVRAIAYPGRDFPGRVVELGSRMGRKNVRSDDPVERNDTKILEVVIELDRTDALVVGQRVMSYVRRDAP